MHSFHSITAPTAHTPSIAYEEIGYIGHNWANAIWPRMTTLGKQTTLLI